MKASRFGSRKPPASSTSFLLSQLSATTLCSGMRQQQQPPSNERHLLSSSTHHHHQLRSVISVEQPPPKNVAWKPHDWPCPSCNAHNFARRTICFSCGEAAPEAPEEFPARKDRESAAKSREGEWVCGGCSSCNFASRLMCFVCSRPRPPNAGTPFSSPSGTGSSIGGRKPPRSRPQQHHEIVRLGPSATERTPRRGTPTERLDLTRSSTVFEDQQDTYPHVQADSGDRMQQHTRTIIQGVDLGEPSTDTVVEKQKPKKGRKKKVSNSDDLDSLLMGGHHAANDNVKGGDSYQHPVEVIPSTPSTASLFDEPIDRQRAQVARSDAHFNQTRDHNSNHLDAPKRKIAELKPGDWLCPRCRTHNFASRHVCFQCSSARPSFLHLSNTSKARDGKISEEELAYSRHIHEQKRRTTDIDEDGSIFACNNGAGRGRLDSTQNQEEGGSGERGEERCGYKSVEGSPRGITPGAPASTLAVRAGHERSLLDRIAQFDTTSILSHEILDATAKRDKILLFGTLRGKLLFGDRKFPEAPVHDDLFNEGGEKDINPPRAEEQQHHDVMVSAFKIGDWRCAGCGYNNYASRTACKSCMTDRSTFATLDPFPPGEEIPAEEADDSGLFTVVHEEADGQLYVRELARRIGEFATLRLVLTGRINITLKRKVMESIPGANTSSRNHAPQQQQSFTRPVTTNNNDKTKPMRGDWWCDKCQFLNFAARLECKNCHLRRTSEVKVHLGNVGKEDPAGGTSATSSLTTASGTKYVPNPLWTPADIKVREAYRKENGVKRPGEGIKLERANLQSMVVSLDSLLDDVLGESED